MDLTIALSIGLPVVIAVTGYIFKALNNRITANKVDADKRLDHIDTELKSAHSREDALREIARVDRDLANLRDDFSKGFDRLYEAMADNKRELLQAINALREKR